MFKNYFKTAFRNLWRNKSFSIINIVGLAAGIATCLLIVLYLQNELSYDLYNEKADRIVRVVFRGKTQGHDIKEANVMPPVAKTLKKDFPEVEDATRIRDYGNPRISIGDKVFRDDRFAFVDSNFFQLFTLPLLKGDAKTALLQPNTVVISRAIAEKYFGNENPVGKVLTLKDQHTSLTVTGMIDAVPANSHFNFGLFASMSTNPESRADSWMESGFYTYLLLPKNYDTKKLEAKMPGVVNKYIGPQLEKALHISMSAFNKQGINLGFQLQPLTAIHLHSDFSGDMKPYGNITYVYLFSAVAVFMLLIACINFMNLSTAGASKRAKEVGIRKVMGSRKGQLVKQFLTESLLITMVALLLALLIVYVTLPWFNSLTGQQLKLDLLSNRWLVPSLILLGLLTGILAGSYPAFYLSSFKPVAVLKGRFLAGKKSVSMRSGLVVFQFFISIFLMIGTIVVYRQLSFVRNAELGYEKDQVIVIQDAYWLGKKLDVFRQQLEKDPRIVSITSSGYLPAGNSYSNNYLAYPDGKSSDLITALRYEVDTRYITTFGMQLAKGRNFSDQIASDSGAMIINETAARTFGFGTDAIGHTISRSSNEGKISTYTIIGVVKDFHFKSLHELITPLVMTLGGNDGAIIVKTKTADVSGLLAMMKKNWDDATAESSFSYTFLDDRFNKIYRSEQNIGNIMIIFAGITIFVACLGLFGLATFTTQQRTKEISIRKVLGADTSTLVALLSKEFLKLVVIAFIIASPVAWLVMNRWLQDFAYRSSITWQVFVMAGTTAILIALMTVSFHSIKAALANPVKSLKSE